MSKRKQICVDLINRFNTMLSGLAGKPPFGHVKFLDLRGTLSTGSDYKTWWDNEFTRRKRASTRSPRNSPPSFDRARERPGGVRRRQPAVSSGTGGTLPRHCVVIGLLVPGIPIFSQPAHIWASSLHVAESPPILILPFTVGLGCGRDLPSVGEAVGSGQVRGAGAHRRRRIGRKRSSWKTRSSRAWARAPCRRISSSSATRRTTGTIASSTTRRPVRSITTATATAPTNRCIATIANRSDLASNDFVLI